MANTERRAKNYFAFREKLKRNGDDVAFQCGANMKEESLSITLSITHMEYYIEF